MKSPQELALAINVAYLYRRFPLLKQLEKTSASWDEVGEAMARVVPLSGSRLHGGPYGKPIPACEVWEKCKVALLEFLFGESGEFDPARERLGLSRTTDTAMLLPSLGLWLSGHLGFSVKLTTPMAAAVLLAIVRTTPTRKEERATVPA